MCRSVCRLLALVAAAALAAAPAAGADTLQTPAPRATDLAAGGGWQAWGAPTADGRWRLTVRAPDGTVTRPDVPDFGFSPNPSIGWDRPGGDGRRLLAVYSRCAGRSAIAGCDVFALDLRDGDEERVAAVSTAGASEYGPSVQDGRWVYVRRGAGVARKGVYTVDLRPGRRRPARRVSAALARETATNGSRAAYSYRSSRGYGLAVRRLSGRGSPLVVVPAAGKPPRSVVMSRDRVSWLLFGEGPPGPRVVRTGRIGGPRRTTARTFESRRRLPPDTDSIALTGGAVTRYLAADGVRTVSPALFGSS